MTTSSALRYPSFTLIQSLAFIALVLQGFTVCNQQKQMCNLARKELAHYQSRGT